MRSTLAKRVKCDLSFERRVFFDGTASATSAKHARARKSHLIIPHATLVIMFYLFRRIYDRFVKAVLDLEDADKRLRKATSDLLIKMANPDEQEK